MSSSDQFIGSVHRMGSIGWGPSDGIHRMGLLFHQDVVLEFAEAHAEENPFFEEGNDAVFEAVVLGPGPVAADAP